jgi:F-type H+-transporting ATPase subunit c
MFLAELTGNIHYGLAVVGGSIGVGIIGGKLVEAVGRNPGAANVILVQAILAMALAEGLALIALFAK